jgi:hypothetical protein
MSEERKVAGDFEIDRKLREGGCDPRSRKRRRVESDDESDIDQWAELGEFDSGGLTHFTKNINAAMKALLENINVEYGEDDLDDFISKSRTDLVKQLEMVHHHFVSKVARHMNKKMGYPTHSNKRSKPS